MRRLDRAGGGRVWNGWDNITTRFLFSTSKFKWNILFLNLSAIFTCSVGSGLICAAVVYSMIQYGEVISRDALLCLPI